MKKSYKVVLDKRVTKKDLAGISPKDRQRIGEKLKALADDPFPPGHKKLVGIKPPVYRIRQGVYVYRIVYRVEDDRLVVFVIQISHRKDMYKN